MIDDYWPRPDSDAGSIEIINLAKALLSFGFEVRFVADREHRAVLRPESGRDLLAAHGVRCLGSAETASVGAYLEQEGSGIALIILNRVWCGGRFMDQARLHCPEARIIFNTIDLHYVRIRREAGTCGMIRRGCWRPNGRRNGNRPSHPTRMRRL